MKLALDAEKKTRPSFTAPDKILTSVAS